MWSHKAYTGVRFHAALTIATLLACSSRPPCDPPTDEALRRFWSRATGRELPRDVCLGRADDPTAPARAMRAVGWSRDDAAKARLALAWIAEIGGAEIVAEEIPEFARAAKAFAPPRTETIQDGGIRIRYWVARPAPTLSEVRYVEVETTFDGRGVIIAQRELDRFELRR